MQSDLPPSPCISPMLPVSLQPFLRRKSLVEAHPSAWFCMLCFPLLTFTPLLYSQGFPAGSDSKESACNARYLGLIPGLGRSPGGGHGNPLQYSCLENPCGQKSLETAVHGADSVFVFLLTHLPFVNKHAPVSNSISMNIHGSMYSLHSSFICMSSKSPAVLRTFKIYSLSNFHIRNTILLAITIRLYNRSPELTHLIIEGLYPLTSGHVQL